MTEEDLKRWLSRANAIRIQREQYEAKVREAEEIATRITRNYEAVPVSVSDDPHRVMDSVVIKNDQLLDVISDLLIKEYTAKTEILKLIEMTLPSDTVDHVILFCRYINGMTMKETAELMEMGISQCNLIQKKSIQAMLEAISEGKYELFSALL